MIEQENVTYDDLVILPLEETRQIANTIKSIEFFMKLLSRTKRWAFVSKIDDDSFLDVDAFYHRFLQESMDVDPGDPTSTTEVHRHAMIGTRLHNFGVDYAGGQFYTLPRVTLELLVKTYIDEPVTQYDEDVLNGILLQKAGAQWRLVEMDHAMAFDFAPHGNSPLAKADENLTLWSHGVRPDAIILHKMKDDEMYLKVANLWSDGKLNLRQSETS